MPPLAHADFIHLRVHSAYSLSAGAIKIKQLVGLCTQHRMPAVAISDTGNLFGALEFAQACIDAGVQPVIGCELALRRGEPAGNGESRGGRPGSGTSASAEHDRIVLLVQNETGYRHLSRLVSKSYLDDSAGEAPQVSLDDLATYGEGLICLAGGPGGPVGRLLGVTGTGMQTSALTMAPAAYVNAIRRLSALVAVVLGRTLFGEADLGRRLAAALLACAGAACLLLARP